MKKTILLIVLISIGLRSNAGVIDWTLDKIWDNVKLIIEKAKEYGAADMLQTLELLDQIACLQNDFELNFDLYENEMGCAMKIKYATALTNLVSAKEAITDYYTDLSSDKETGTTIEKVKTINFYLTETINFMQDFNKMIEIDIKDKMQRYIDEKVIDQVSTYTITK